MYRYFGLCCKDVCEYLYSITTDLVEMSKFLDAIVAVFEPVQDQNKWDRRPSVRGAMFLFLLDVFLIIYQDHSRGKKYLSVRGREMCLF